jgi:hypothetical protein
MWAWGIDPAAQGAWFAFTRPDTMPIHVGVEPLKRKGSAPIPDDLAELSARLRTFIPAMIEHYPPVAAYIEMPTGRYPNKRLDYAAGVITQHLATLCAPARVHTVTPPGWKKVVLGAGQGLAPKEAVMARALELGYRPGVRGPVQDEADAVCIAAMCMLEHLPFFEGEQAA